MINSHYQNELNNLRRLADEFARRNPALAPLLGVDSASDPDVERLLEGVAFLTGMLRQRLDDEFPEFIQELAQLLYPHYLQPLPCMTLIQFEAKAALQAPLTIAAGCEVSSVPVDGQRVRFRTTQALELPPLELLEARWQGGAGEERSLVMEFALTCAEPELWQQDSLVLYLGDGLAEACNWLRLLQRHVREVRLSATGQPVQVLAPGCLRCMGFDPGRPLLPFPNNAHPGYRGLQEYFALPEKFLFIEVNGFKQWRARGADGRFTLRIKFDELPSWAPAVSPSSFLLGVSPAINLFEQQAHPLRIDHQRTDYRIQPAAQEGNLRIHSVLEVSSYASGGQQTVLQAFNTFSREGCYTLRIRPSSVESKGYEHFLSLPYSAGSAPRDMTLSVDLLCTHGKLPESLRLGDLNQPSDNTPPRLVFKNIRGITASQPPRFDDKLLWRMLSQLNANHFRLADRDYLCGLLSLYVVASGDGVMDANQRRIDSIETIDVLQERRFIRGLPVEGTAIRVVCRGDHFLSPGSFYLFGCVLDEFFSSCAALNSFTAFTLVDSFSQESLTWPAKIGCQRLL